jgi:molybdopterin/thiamine biosynthesis adenylyltransferase
LTATLVLPDSVSRQIEDISRQPLETAGVLLVSVVPSSERAIRLLGREYHPVPTGAYLRRQEDSLSIASDGYVRALARAEDLGAAALWVHTHPGDGSSPQPSDHDEVVDRQLAETFRLRTGSDYYGALIVSPSGAGLRFSGHVGTDRGPELQIDRLWCVGDRFRLTHSIYRPAPEGLGMFDRNVRAFGPAVQNTLRDLTVGLVGCGGTGSAVAEQLVRLGVRRFVLLDPDTLTESNLTRVYGSQATDIGQQKVEICARNLRGIAPDVACETVPAMLTTSSAAKRLIHCDVVFGCTDDNAGRLVLSRMPTYLLTPVIDCGVLLSSQGEGQLTGIDGRVTLVLPEHACLLCRGRIDVARASAELMTPDERVKLADEGYAPALGRTEPAVVTFTSLVASAAVSELLERLIGYGPTPRPTEILLRCHEREISVNQASSKPKHYCDPGAGKVGRGPSDPLFDMAWTH